MACSRLRRHCYGYVGGLGVIPPPTRGGSPLAGRSRLSCFNSSADSGIRAIGSTGMTRNIPTTDL